MDDNAPFSDAIRLAPIPADFRPPRLEVYRGVTDPREHVQRFEAAVRYRQPDEATRCHLLANTLKGAAFSWFIKLPKGHISSYEHLKWELIARFIGRTRMVVSDMVLANIKQGERKSLRDYTSRFFAAAVEAEDVDPTVAMHNFRRGLKAGDLSKSLQLAKPRSYPELVARASQFMLLEDAESSPTDAPRVKQEKRKRKHRGAEPPATRMHMTKSRDRDEGKPRHVQHKKLFLSRPLPEVYAAAVKQGWIRPAGHRLHKCRGLRALLEKLMNQGKLKEFMQMAPTFTAVQKGKAPEVAKTPAKALLSPGSSQPGRSYPPATRTINVIFSIDPAIARRQEAEVGGISEQHSSSIPLTFCQEDLPREGNLHNDPIVVVARIADFDIRRVLLDSGSAADIRFESAFLQIGVQIGKSPPRWSHLTRFLRGEGSTSGIRCLTCILW
ncbi:hypothetical protein AXF42_Ash012163 [Apostasia shenzhenica]|uniref:Retrotransposon gag domain-containing protein n=1 Tax=Apostasia shenzhenica TaxID=1088818 RepID=A0A2I0B459_9ASPA|nr:hypothetical protein AXF42_Ash012163 [Apostasia shenzhenica]